MSNSAKIAVGNASSGNEDSGNLGPFDRDALKKEIRLHVEDLLRDLDSPSDRREFHDVGVDVEVVRKVLVVGRLLPEYFLASRHENAAPTVDGYRKPGFRRRGTRSRTLKAFFGEVEFRRMTMARRYGQSSQLASQDNGDGVPSFTHWLLYGPG